MMRPQQLIVLFLLVITASAAAQKLKKSDRIIANNIQSHLDFLHNEKLTTAGSERLQLVEEYIADQLRKVGCRPMGDSGSWTQKFSIGQGKEIASSHLSLNGKTLLLYSDYFPFACSASKATEASVAMELAENGVPWFIELKELLDNDGEEVDDTARLISSHAKKAAAKGASALIVYNGSSVKDLAYSSPDKVEAVEIPVLYITRAAAKKHLSKESTSIDIKLNVVMQDRFLTGRNVIGYIDNKADNSTIVGTHFDKDSAVAVLLELSRLLKGRDYRKSNYLFVAFSPEKSGLPATTYFKDHPVAGKEKFTRRLDLDTAGSSGLPAVKKGLAFINGQAKQ